VKAKPRRLDLDAIRKEATGEPVTIVVGGVDYTLPSELPFSFVSDAASLADVDPEDPSYGARTAQVADHVLRNLFGEETWESLSRQLDLKQVMALLQALPGLYGLSDAEGEEALGEVSASA
jgi:hypothetical protein